MNDTAIFLCLKRQAQYALNSHSRDLVNECYGAAKMARTLGEINKAQFMELNQMLVRDGLNNPGAKIE